MKKSGTMKKMLTYYKPYMRVFWTDMFFATLSAAVALIIPLVVRYVTYNLVYREPAEILHQAAYIAIGLFALVAVDCYSKFYICNYGHVMGAKIEYDMRAEIFAHYQKLSFSFYDDQKVGQLMSRITTDLFDISELMHHGPENIILSVIKIAGALIILVNISPMLAVAAFAILPFMLLYAFVLNKKMRLAFKQNRVKIADINAQIEDNLSGIRVVKSFANEAIENRKFKQGNDGFLAAKKNSYFYMGSYQAGLGAFTTLIQVSVILTGTVLIAKGSVDVSDLVTFMLYISVFTDPVRTLIDFTEQFQNGYTGFERFQEILAIHPDIEDKKDAVELKDVKANAHEFIMSLPNGYDTDIGQRGIKLSGGQKQRLSIARVFLKNPPILIFDEATSALDNESEKVVQDSLEKLAKNRTTFVIAHRLSTIKNAEKIIVLSEDGIEESGTHEELMDRKGTYEKLYNMQFHK